VIGCHMTSREVGCAGGINQQKVSVRANRDSSFARPEPEDASRSLSHEARQPGPVQASRERRREQQGGTILDTGQAVGDETKIIVASCFLAAIEAVVIGGNQIEDALIQPLPQGFLMMVLTD